MWFGDEFLKWFVGVVFSVFVILWFYRHGYQKFSFRKLTGLNLMLAVWCFLTEQSPPAGLSCIYRINLGPVNLSSEVLNLNKCLKISDGYWTVKEESSLVFAIFCC